MLEEYSKEQLWKIYEKLPEELKEAIFSEKTAESIWDIADRNEIEDISKLAKLIGRVLMGLLNPEDLKEKLKTELNIDEEKAKKIRREIEMFIFHPVRIYLTKLYKPEVVSEEKKEIEKITLERKPSTPPKVDIYREPIEKEE